MNSVSSVRMASTEMGILGNVLVVEDRKKRGVVSRTRNCRIPDGDCFMAHGGGPRARELLVEGGLVRCSDLR